MFQSVGEHLLQKLEVLYEVDGEYLLDRLEVLCETVGVLEVPCETFGQYLVIWLLMKKLNSRMEPEESASTVFGGI
nr:hypothetical protein BgiMline_028013 [Biomphalaria glabrata]